MLTGELVTLRPIRTDDLSTLHATLTHPDTWLSTSDQPLWPMPLSAYEAKYAKYAADEEAEFAIEANGELVGRCALHAVDELSRNGQIGITIGAAFRGKGYGRDAVGVLLDYGFNKRNLHRIQLEALADNQAAIKAYAACGFVAEGVLREHAYVAGTFVGVIVMSVLRTEWLAARSGR